MEEDPEQLLLHYLRRKAGESVGYWEPLEKIADILLGHIPGRNVFSKKEREQKRNELNQIMVRLIREKKVIRYCHTKNGIKAGLRINEALV